MSTISRRTVLSTSAALCLSQIVGFQCYPGALDLPACQAAPRQWETPYNTERPHQALGYATPQQHLIQLLSHMS